MIRAIVLALALVLALVLALALGLLAAPALGVAQGYTPPVEQPAEIKPPPRVIEVRPTRDPVKPRTWKDTAQAIGRGGLISIGINVFVWTARAGLAIFGIIL